MGGIVRLFTRESVALLAVASALGWPLAWWAMDRWLADFAYRIELGAGALVASTGLALVLAVVVVASRSLGAALRSPVHTLRYK